MFEIVLIVFITMALAEMVKRARLVQPAHIPIFAVVCAVLVVAGYGASNIPIYAGTGAGSRAVVSGTFIGLLSCGLHSFAKCVTSLAHLLSQFRLKIGFELRRKLP